MAKVFIFGNPHSPLVSQRGLIALEGGYEVDWFWSVPFSLPGARAFSMPGSSGGKLALRAVLEPYYLSRALAASQPDLVHVHYASKALSAIPLSRHRPLVVTSMGSDISPAVGYRHPYKFFTKRLLDQATCITSKSDQMDRMLLAIGDYASKLERITWGVDLSLYDRAADTAGLRQQLGIPAGALVLLDPRAAKPLYNKHLILEAFKGYLQQGGPGAVLLVSEFSADQEYLARLKQFASQNDLGGHLRFLPPLQQAEMAPYYALADVVISVPLSDGFPQTIYEAWASGCFLLLGDLPQYAEAVQNGRAATLVPLGDAPALTGAMLDVARDPQLRSRHRQNARDYVAQHADARQQKEQVLALYDRFLAGAS